MSTLDVNSSLKSQHTNMYKDKLDLLSSIHDIHRLPKVVRINYLQYVYVRSLPIEKNQASITVNLLWP